MPEEWADRVHRRRDIIYFDLSTDHSAAPYHNIRV